jgi:Domain of Unknown Function with PDB structure (DUF3857)
MKKITLICLFFVQTIFGQNTEFSKQKFVLKADNQLIKPTASEAKEKAIIVNEQTYIEILADSSDELSCYYGSYKRVHLNDGSAIDRYNKIILPIASKNDLILIKARSISPNGTIKEVGNEAVKEVEEEKQVYNMLAFEGLEVGGEIEYYFLIKTDIRTYGSHSLQEEIPIRNAEFKIISPAHLVYDMKLYNRSQLQKIDSIDSKITTSIVLKDIQPQFEEKYTADKADEIRIEYRLLYNKSRGEEKVFTWQDAGEKLMTFMTADLKDSRKEVEKFIKKEKINGKNEVSKIRAIENFMKANIGIKEEAEGSSVMQVLQDKFGSDNSVSKAYIALFDAMDIPFDLVVGINRFKKRFDKDFESWAYLDNTFFYFPNQKLFLDPKNPFVRLGGFDPGLEGSDALFVQLKNGAIQTEIKQIPFSTVDQNFDNIDAAIVFDENMEGIKVKTQRYFGGLQGASLKGYFNLSNEEQKKAISNEILKQTITQDAVFENIVVKNYDLNNAEEVDAPLIMTADASIKSMIEKAGNKVFFKLGDIIGPQVEMYNEHPREHEIDVQTAHKYDRKITIEIPANYKIKGLDKINRNIVFQHDGKDAMGFVSSYEMKGNQLIVVIKEFYNQVFLPKSAYENFQKVINASADFNKVTLVLEK